MNLLIDTHILLWWYLDRPELPDRYAKLLESAKERGERIGLSVMSLWEIAKGVSLGRLNLSFSLDHWFEQLEDDPVLKVLPLERRIILESMRLGQDFPRDPSDQLIASTARCHELRLVTVDEKIVKSGVVSIA